MDFYTSFPFPCLVHLIHEVSQPQPRLWTHICPTQQSLGGDAHQRTVLNNWKHRSTPTAFRKPSPALIPLPEPCRTHPRSLCVQQIERGWLHSGIGTRQAQFPEFLESSLACWKQWLQMSTVSFLESQTLGDALHQQELHPPEGRERPQNRGVSSGASPTEKSGKNG